MLVPSAAKMAYHARRHYMRKLFRETGSWKVNNPGFKESWLKAFVERIEERFKEARAAAVTAAPEGSSVALVRLNGALVKVRKYVDDKFSSKRNVSALNSLRANHRVGAAMGRAAADSMPIGRRGVTSSPARKELR